ncbi:STAS-like domain-containing protein [Rhizobium hidalgonense]|uniref:DUF4325 domain-containing protein n=1 Tax=Rhizobium hidalgonense TaxID=1538159 RepID=A0ABX4K064_9HYPH|nr:STAS-like domain-containing protein [Rhizobium hidalgonense]PDT24796.1 DUF4325 domain-containing protein [Rhizobium hidalgonense]PON05395.1 hypothetical protein ATY29_22830 [Rhizobium hidalgonense]
MENQIVVATDFTRYPGPRYRKSGPFSGQQFREDVLAPRLKQAIESGTVLVVILDDVAGYGSSFLDESFAGLVRAGFSQEELDKHLRIEAHTARFRHHAVRAREYIAEQSARTPTAH